MVVNKYIGINSKEDQLRKNKYEILEQRALDRVSSYVGKVNNKKLNNAVKTAVKIIEKNKGFFESKKCFCNIEDIGSGNLKDLKLQRAVDMLTFCIYKNMDKQEAINAVSNLVSMNNSAGEAFAMNLIKNNGPEEVLDFYKIMFNNDFNSKLVSLGK